LCFSFMYWYSRCVARGTVGFATTPGNSVSIATYGKCSTHCLTNVSSSSRFMLHTSRILLDRSKGEHAHTSPFVSQFFTTLTRISATQPED
jgi:hypothetical protein